MLKQIGMAATPLNQFLSDMDEKKGKIPCCQEVSLIQRRVRKVIKTILLEVRRENPFFVTTLINSGSFYEGTKVGHPDEFDFLVQLDAFSYPGEVVFEELPCSTVCVVPSESACKNIKFAFVDNDDEHYMGWFDLRDFEWKKNIKTPFFKLFNSKAENFEAYGMKVVLKHELDDLVKAPPPLSKHGPAYTLLLEWNGGNVYKGLRISVDLSLAVKINSRPLKVDLDSESPSGRVLTSLLDSLPYFFAVGSYRDILTEVHPNFFAGQEEQLRGFYPRNFFLRCSQSRLEQLLFQEFGPESGQSKCLRLLKVLRDIMFPVENETKVPFHDAGKLVSSYVLKTLVLFEWRQNPEDVLWTGSKLSQRFLNILGNLVDHLKGKKLRSFFYSDYNLFQATSQDEDFMNAASIITILVDRLVSFKNLPEYKFEDCLAKITQDFEMICRKKKLTSLLSGALWYKFFYDDYVQKVVERSLRNEGKGEIYELHERAKHPIEKVLKVIVENEEKRSFFDLYVQALLVQIAPKETLVLTNIKVKYGESLSSAAKQFQKIARQRMAEHENLPSYYLWTQEHSTIEESVYKLSFEEPVKNLVEFLFDIFQEDIKILHNELMAC